MFLFLYAGVFATFWRGGEADGAAEGFGHEDFFFFGGWVIFGGSWGGLGWVWRCICGETEVGCGGELAGLEGEKSKLRVETCSWSLEEGFPQEN